MSDDASLNILTLCTGNVARSVMLGYMLTTLAESTGQDWNVRTAGTHVAEGSAMSGRTREALKKVEELGDQRAAGRDLAFVVAGLFFGNSQAEPTQLGDERLHPAR